MKLDNLNSDLKTGYNITGNRYPAAKTALVTRLLIQMISNRSFCNPKTRSIPAVSALIQVKTQFLQTALVQTRKRSEQAEVGQSPTLLALRFAAGVLSILRGYFRALSPMK